MSRKWLLPLLYVCAASLAGWTHETPSLAEGRITGVVLTESGQPASDAQVCTSILRGDDSEHIDCSAKTDSQGRFTVEQLGARTYKVFAINEAEGYSIHNQRFTDQTLTVGTNPPWPNVTIRQRNKGGILVGSITDKLTGSVIRDAEVRYVALDHNGEDGIAGFNGSSPVTVPSNCDLIVIVMAKGYRSWVFTVASNSERPTLRLEPGQRKELDVQLEPLHGSSSK